ncbi:MAG: hypothetical protein EOL88_00915 [Bacteroidia bacterium]|nr:hypothetical protein [Bacteroidia bacterium]
MLKIAHIVNPVKVSSNSDLYFAQPVTFETMRMARDLATGIADIKLMACMFPEDKEMEPEGFHITEELYQSVSDFYQFKEFRKLPLVGEIFDRLTKEADADYYIYSNVDIALKPHFYQTIVQYINSGLKAFVVNRRTISDDYTSVSELPLMFAERGKKHPGYDCFIFHRTLIPGFSFGNACVGANWIGRIILANLLSQTEEFEIFENEDLTFHIGDDKKWSSRRFEDYNTYNEKILVDLVSNFLTIENLKNRNWFNNLISYYNDNQLADAKFHLTQEDKLIPVFNYEGKDPETRLPDLSQEPVFVVGHPRSGTTLIQALIGTQNKTGCTFETHFFDIIIRDVFSNNSLLFGYKQNILINNIRRFSPISNRTLHYIRDTEQLSKKVLFEMIIEDNLYFINKTIPTNNIRWIEKTPDHVFYMNEILNLFPNAKFVNVVRNPEKVILSRRNNFFWDDEAKWDLEKHAMLWNDSINSAIEFSNYYPDRLISVRLEDMVDKNTLWVRNLCKFLNIKYKRRNLKKYPEIAKKIIHPWEAWKKDATTKISKNLAHRNSEHLSTIDLLELAFLTTKQREYFDYSIDITTIINHKTAGVHCDIHQIIQKNKAYKAERNEVIELADNLKSSVLNLEERLKDNIEHNKSKDQEVHKLLKIIDDKNYWLETLKNRLENSNVHINKLKNILQNNNTDKASLSIAIEKEYNNFDAEFVKLRNQIRDLINQNEALTKQNQLLIDEKESSEKQGKINQSKIEELQAKLVALESKYRTLYFATKNM